MAEYIEREALTAKAVYMHGFGKNKYVPLRAVEDAPAADVAPVVHGRWIEKPFLLGTSNFCSLCDSFYGMPHGKFNYCPNCGAYMKDGE